MSYHRPTILFTVWAAWATLGRSGETASAQQFPSRIQGNWEWRQTLPPRDGSWAGSCILPATTESALITIGERFIIWGVESISNARPQVRIISSRRFARKHLSMGFLDLRKLGIRSSRVEVITLGDPPFLSTYPVDLILVRNPDNLVFEKCGEFYEVIRKTAPIRK